MLEEIHFEQSGLTESGAAKLGRILKASAVLIVTINSAGVTSEQAGWVVNGSPQERHTASCNMSARLISVEKAEVLGITSLGLNAVTANREDVSPAILSVARAIAVSIPNHGVR